LYIDPLGDTDKNPNKHTIEKGDTYYNLAKNSKGKYTVEDLKKWNPGVDHMKLKIGSEINIAEPGKAEAKEKFNSDIDVDPINHSLDYFMGEAKGNGKSTKVTNVNEVLTASIYKYSEVEFSGAILKMIKNELCSNSASYLKIVFYCIVRNYDAIFFNNCAD